MTPILLTADIYMQLIQQGYSFLLLKDAVKKDGTLDIVYEPVRNTPLGNKYSCTSISDEMVKHFLGSTGNAFRIYIEAPEAIAA